MYIPPFETPKLNNLDIRIAYEGYSLKKIFDPKWVTCGMVCKQFCKSTLQLILQGINDYLSFLSLSPMTCIHAVVILELNRGFRGLRWWSRSEIQNVGMGISARSFSAV